MRISFVLTAAALTAATATAATAESKFSHYGTVEGWNVFVDHEKNSCMLETMDVAENVIQMGLTEDRGVAYIGVFTKAKTNIKKDETEGVAILLGDHIYVGQATGMRGNITKGYSGGYVLTDDPQVMKDIQQQYEMVIFPEKEYSFIVDLTGTKKAIDLTRECNKAQM